MRTALEGQFELEGYTVLDRTKLDKDRPTRRLRSLSGALKRLFQGPTPLLNENEVVIKAVDFEFSDLWEYWGTVKANRPKKLYAPMPLKTEEETNLNNLGENIKTKGLANRIAAKVNETLIKEIDDKIFANLNAKIAERVNETLIKEIDDKIFANLDGKIADRVNQGLIEEINNLISANLDAKIAEQRNRQLKLDLNTTSCMSELDSESKLEIQNCHDFDYELLHSKEK